MLANEPTRSYIGPTRGRAQLYLRSTYVHRSINHNTKSQKNLVVVIHPYDGTRPTNMLYIINTFALQYIFSSRLPKSCAQDILIHLVTPAPQTESGVILKPVPVAYSSRGIF